MSGRKIGLFTVAFVAVALAAPAGAKEPKAKASTETPAYKVVDKIAGADGGGWDLSNVDPKTRRLYVSRPHGIMVVDLDTGKVTDKFADGDGVHGILPIPGTHMLISANEDTNAAVLFDEGTGKVVATIPAGKHPDSATFDPKTGLVVVINQDGGDATLIDVKMRAAVSTIPIGGQRRRRPWARLCQHRRRRQGGGQERNSGPRHCRPESFAAHCPSGLRPSLRPRL